MSLRTAGVSGQYGGTVTAAAFMPDFAPAPSSYGRCGSWLLNQKQNGLSRGTLFRNSAKVLKLFPAGLRWRPRLMKSPGPKPFSMKQTEETADLSRSGYT